MGIIPCVILNYNAVFGDVRFRDAHAQLWDYIWA